MPHNPNRASQGGDVEGQVPTDDSQGKPIQIARASIDPGYSIDTTLSDGGTEINKADLTRGYCTYGKAIGESEAY